MAFFLSFLKLLSLLIWCVELGLCFIRSVDEIGFPRNHEFDENKHLD